MFTEFSLSFLLVVWATGIFSIFYSFTILKISRQFLYFLLLIFIFLLSMSLLILSNSLILFFLGWEGVGLMSYLLISFWVSRPHASISAVKAIFINRLGDLALLLSISYLSSYLNISTFTQLNGTVSTTYQLIICLLLMIISAICKSVQFPMISWLVSAMEGPTPVSALMHAATLVTAGTILLVKIMPVATPFAPILLLFAFFTSIYCSFRAMVEYDFKTITALSTAAQMSIVFILIGVSNTTAALNYLTIHATFKSLLFWIVGIYNHENKNQNLTTYRITNSSITLVVFLSAGVLLGLPFLSVFYFKEVLMAILPYSNYFINIVAVSTFTVEFLSTIYAARIVFLISAHRQPAPTKLQLPLSILLYCFSICLFGRILSFENFNILSMGGEIGCPKLVNAYSLNSIYGLLLFLLIVVLLLLIICRLIAAIYTVLHLVIYLAFQIVKFLHLIFMGFILAVVSIIAEWFYFFLGILFFFVSTSAVVYRSILRFFRMLELVLLPVKTTELYLWAVLMFYYTSLACFLIQTMPHSKLGRILLVLTYILLVPPMLIECGDTDSEKVYFIWFLIPILFFTIAFAAIFSQWTMISCILYALMFTI